MSRALLVLCNDTFRARAIDWIKKAPKDTRITFQGPKRTLDQNAKMWAMLTEVAAQRDHHGRRYTPDEWKVIFLSALGKEMKFAPALDGKSFIPLGQSSSNLSVAEMAELIEFISAWGAENGIEFKEAA